MPKPLAARLGEGRLLLARDINTAFVNLGASADTERGGSHASDADRSRKESESPAAAATTELSADRVTLDRRQIPWTTAPESIGYSYPYVVALQTAKGGTLEVRNPDTLSLLQTISLPGASQCHFPPPTVSLAHAGKGFHVSGERTVWRMQATDYDAQVRELVDARRYDEAISVLGMLEGALLVADKEQTLREVKMRKAEELFRRRKFRDSMDLFNDESVHAPPERVLRLFPREISGELSGYADRVEEEHMGPAKGEGVGGDGAAAATEHGEPAATAAGKANGEKAASAGTKAAEQATGTDAAASKSGEGGGIAAGLTRYLMGGHRKTASVDTTPAVSSPKKASKDDDGADDAASIKTKATTTSGNEFPVLEGKDLVTAVTELSSYLVGTRTRLQRLLDPTTGKLRPKAAVKGREGPLLDEAFKSTLTGEGREPDTQALEAQLQATFRLVDTTLFRAYMFSRPALAVSLFRIPNFCDPDVVSAKLQEHNRFAELVDFLHGKKLHRQALELLRKFGQSPDDEGDADKVPPALRGPQRTVTYLQTLSSEHIDMILEFSEWTLRAEGEPGMDVFLADTERAESLPRDRIVKFLGGISPRLEARYLQHIISELGDATPDFHNRLVELLIQDLRFAPRGDVWDAEMERLVAFLRESRQYSLSRAFALIPRDGKLTSMVRHEIGCGILLCLRGRKGWCVWFGGRGGNLAPTRRSSLGSLSPTRRTCRYSYVISRDAMTLKLTSDRQIPSSTRHKLSCSATCSNTSRRWRSTSLRCTTTTRLRSEF